MPDLRFHHRTGPYSLRELADISGSELSAHAAPAQMVLDVAPLDSAGADTISFLDNPKYAPQFAESRAGACVIHPKHAERAPGGMALLLNSAPYAAYARIAAVFYPPASPEGRIAPGALISETAVIGAHCDIASGAVIGEHADIGEGCRIMAGAVIGDGVRMGAGCTIHAGAILSHCILGDYAIIHPNVCIGQDGFGHAPGADGIVKVPQLGRVIIGNDVDIGAGTCIDRGSGPDTVIGDGTKIDNLVQIGHNVQIGRYCLIVSQVGIAGSTRIGDRVMIGGQVGIGGHAVIGDEVQIAAGSKVKGDLAPHGVYGGIPAVPVREWRRQIAAIARLGKKKVT